MDKIQNKRVKIIAGFIFAALPFFFPAIPAFAGAADYYAAGYRDYNNQNYDGAIANYTKAVELDPSGACGTKIRGSAYHGRAIAHEKKMDYARAIEDYTSAIKVNPEYVRCYNSRGRVYLDNIGEYDKAIADFNRGIKLDPPDELKSDLYNNRGVAYDRKGEKKKALADFIRAVQLDPKNTKARENRKIIYENFNQAQNARKQEAEDARNAVNALVASGGEKYKSGDYDNAIVDWYNAISMDGNLEPKLTSSIAKAYAKRGAQRALDGDYKKALDDFNESLKLVPGSKDIIKARNQVKKDLANPPKRDPPSTAQVEKKNLSASECDTFKSCAEGGIASRIDPERILYYSRALSFWTPEDGPKNKATILNNRAYFYAGIKQYDKAIADLTEAIKLDPSGEVGSGKPGMAYHARGSLYLAKNDTKKAISDFDAALNINPLLAEAKIQSDTAKKRRNLFFSVGLTIILGIGFLAGIFTFLLPWRRQPGVSLLWTAVYISAFFVPLVFIPLIIISSVWVYSDAAKIMAKIPGPERKLLVRWALSPAGWTLGSLFLWGITFPLYLSGRLRYMEFNKTGSIPEKGPGFFKTISLFFSAAPVKKPLQPAPAVPETPLMIRHTEAIAKMFAHKKDYWAYLRIEEMIEGGDYEKAFAAYGAKSSGNLTVADKVNLFRIHLQLNNKDTALLIYEDIKDSFMLKEDHLLQTNLSGLCSAKGLPGLAEKISGLSSGRSSSGPDAGEGAASLVKEGQYANALVVLGRKPVNELKLEDYNLFLESYLRLGDFMRAELTLKSIRQIISERFPVERFQGRIVLSQKPKPAPAKPAPAPDAEFYFSMAKFCVEQRRPDLAAVFYRIIAEVSINALPVKDNVKIFYDLGLMLEGAGDNKSALEIYRLILDETRGYKDAAERYKLLKENQGMVQQTPVRKITPSTAALKTGTDVSGKTLANNRYELKGILGEGGMGVVYEAWDWQSNRKVAVKRMHSSLRAYPQEYARFKREAEIVERLKHPNIVGVQGMIEEGQDVYLVFDYVEGKPLSEVISEKKRFPLDECKRIFRGVAGAVNHAHANNVIHRDLKPSNIMLGSGGLAMVMDFGLASELRESLTRISHQTKSGTPAYMAPEQYAGIVKKESDIYAMGVCLYEMLTGELPFTGFDFEDLKKKKNYREPSEMLPWLPGGMDTLIDKALEPEPSMRIGSANEFMSMLEKL